MMVSVMISLVFLSFTNAQISITGSDGRNYAVQGQRYGINCTAPASLDTSIIMLKGSERVCSLLMESCPILPSDRFPCGCSISASGDRILYHQTDNATVKGFDYLWLCKEFNSSKMAASLAVTVYSGPDNIRLNSSSRVVLSSGGSAQAVQCSADCNPPCSYFWHKGSATGPVVFRQRVLQAEIIQEQLPGSQVYTCVAINRKKPIHNKQTILIEIIVEPLTKPIAPEVGQIVSETNAPLTVRPLLTNTGRLMNFTGITDITIASRPDKINVSLTPPIITLQSTTIQSTTTTTVSTIMTTLTTTTPTTTMLTSTTEEPTLEESDIQTTVGVGVIVGTVLGLIVLVVVAIFVVVIIYKRGQARNSRILSYAPGNPIYINNLETVNNPDTVGVTPNLQGTLLIRNNEYMDNSQGSGDPYGVRSPTYVNTTQPPLYTSLDKEQLKEQISNTYEPLDVSQTVTPQYHLYTCTQLESQQKQGSSEVQSNPGLPGSPVYMNTGTGSTLLGNNSDSIKIDANDASEEPVSLEYMNLNVPKK